MLTPRQIAALRAGPPARLVARAISLARVTQVRVAAAIGVTQAYVSDVACERHRTITVENAHRFANYFGCRIDDLFPPPEEEAGS